ncbi:MAG: hypothetical protein H0W55_10310 [Actinobacteria bacterium]|nr:hypothetical protein [Actinomycetota bacterium]MDQ3530951.1 hypothetical protein [Actinomycetota bacterium]
MGRATGRFLQAGLIELNEVQRRAKELEARRSQLDNERTSLSTERRELAKDNRLRQRVDDFAGRVMASLDGLNFEQHQRLLRLVVEEVRVQGWQVEIALRIPLDENTQENRGGPELPNPFGAGVSSDTCLRSLHHDDHRVVQRKAGRSWRSRDGTFAMTVWRRWRG